MSTGYKGKFHRQNIVSCFAKELVRRSRSHCELCSSNGVKLDVMEVPPISTEQEPHPDQCIFICECCREQIEKPKKMEADYWRCLANTLYSEVPAVQVMAFRMLKRLAAREVHWACELLEHAYLDNEVEAWANQAE
jgi:protein PhnA